VKTPRNVSTIETTPRLQFRCWFSVTLEAASYRAHRQSQKALSGWWMQTSEATDSERCRRAMSWIYILSVGPAGEISYTRSLGTASILVLDAYMTRHYLHTN